MHAVKRHLNAVPGQHGPFRGVFVENGVGVIDMDKDLKLHIDLNQISLFDKNTKERI